MLINKKHLTASHQPRRRPRGAIRIAPAQAEGVGCMALFGGTANLGPLCRRKITVAGQSQWYFTKSVRLSKVDHPVRVVVLWSEERATKPRKIFVTNRTYWEVHRILKTYRKRWTGTETFHRDGKQHLGMGECQLRNGVGQTRHMHLVVLAYTALMRQLKHDRAQEWAHIRLTTIGESCRMILRETLGKTLDWVVQCTREGMSLPEIKQRLSLP